MKKSILTSLAPIAAWSVFVWATRIRNIWTDDELSTTGQVWRFTIAVVFVAGGLAIAALVARRRHTELTGPQRRWVAAFALGSSVYWIARGAQILAADHDTAFKVVHTVLGVVSVAVAAIALQYVSQDGQAQLSAA